MIICSNCETAQFLQITQSRVYFENDEPSEITEKYECTLCEATGKYEYSKHDHEDDDVGDVTGDIEVDQEESPLRA